MDWYPLKLSTPVAPHVFGGRTIPEKLGRGGLPDGLVAETWEVSDADGYLGDVTNGSLSGQSLRRLVQDYPEELMGRGWSGESFPVLTKFIDGKGMLPVHLHADDEPARKLEGQANGKTEAWHILDAAPGATALVGLKEGVDRETLREALLRQDFDSVMRRLPVRAGETIYVPGGTLHSFGPDTLIYEIEQTSNIQQHAMHWMMEDGSTLPDEQWRSNIDALLDELKPEPKPDFQPGLSIRVDDGVERVFLCAGPYFALERWRAGTAAPLRHSFETAVILSNTGAPVSVNAGGSSQWLGRAETLLLPAALGRVEIEGPADVLIGYLPDLERDVWDPLGAAGYAPEVIATLGEGLDG
jgi:mannose-6-phosphate isomerase